MNRVTGLDISSEKVNLYFRMRNQLLRSVDNLLVYAVMDKELHVPTCRPLRSIGARLLAQTEEFYHNEELYPS